MEEMPAINFIGAIFTFLFLTSSFLSNAQNFDTINSAFKTGNVSEMQKAFAGKIELVFKNQEVLYTKEQALTVLEIFFAAHPPKTFEAVHQGRSPLGSQ